MLPELFAQLNDSGIRVVLLVPTAPQNVSVPDYCEVKVLKLASYSWFTRLMFDQLLLPLWLMGRHDTVLFCSGNFPPLVKTVPTVVLVRNAVYFEPQFLGRETAFRRHLLRAQAALIRLGAHGCRAIHYPSQYMRALFESQAPGLRSHGVLNYYGIRDLMLRARETTSRPPANDRLTFLYVMNYTLQKNVGYLLHALVLARDRGVNVRVIVTSWLDAGPRSTKVEDRLLIEQHELVEQGYLRMVGPTYGADLVRLYQDVDACVFPSICESFGHPLVEALAVGKPIVCADRSYAREICGNLAKYVDPERPEDLVRLWERWPKVAHEYVPPRLDALTARFSWPDHVSRLLETLVPQATA